MRPLTGSASGPSPYDVEQPPDMQTAMKANMAPEKEHFHNTMADFDHRKDANRAEMIGLNPSDPQYTQKLAALQAQHGALTTEKARFQMLHPWGGPDADQPPAQMPGYGGPGQAPPAGQMVPPKQAASDERQFKEGELKNQVAGAEGDPDQWAEAKGQLARFKMDNPWGSPGNHPGILGKFGHVIGNALGAFSPQAELQAEERGARAAETHGTEMEQKNAQIAKDQEAEREGKSREGLIDTQKQRLQQKPIGKPEGLPQMEADIVAEDQQKGVDPAKDPRLGQIQDAITATQKEGAEKTPPHITVQGQDGKSHIMERDPATGQYSIDRGIAPPNYAQVMPQNLGTKTTTILGPDNIQHRMQYNPETGRYDIDMGVDPTGAAGHQIFQAAAIENLAPQVIADINANRAILGNLSSYYKQWLAGTPVADPKAAQMMSELMSLAAMQPALHAFRSTNAMESFEKMIGGLAKDPDATIATINGLMKTPQAFTNLVHGKGNTPAQNNTPPATGGRPSFAEWKKNQQPAP